MPLNYKMNESFVAADASRFEATIRRFDEENAHDPNREPSNGKVEPRELVYARWLTDWVLRVCPNASEPLRLAARCQHICRWTVPRESYPMTRVGYLQWRADLKKFHAQKAGEILREVGYGEDIITRVQELNLKKNLAKDPETQVLEDGLCLVFLEHQFAALASKTAEDKMLNALKKSWNKMSPAARELASALKYGPSETELLKKALSQT
jgi:hypothetical protein